MNKEISLIIPVYNEHQTIVELLDELEEKVSSSYNAFIIFDHDDDSTLTRRMEIHDKFENINFIKNTYGPGVIGAFKTGFDAADSKYIVPIMADLSDMPESINSMYAKIQEGYDLVVASRYMKGGRKIGGPRIKYYLSRLSNSLLYNLTDLPLHDITNAFIMYKKEVIKTIQIESTGGFEITMEIIAKSYEKNMKMTEVPTINRDRAAGQSNFKMMTWMKNYLYWFIHILKVYSKKKMGL
ncbi:MAG: glycosyltransferase family 2 protein [Reichenbachiella sp.]